MLRLLDMGSIAEIFSGFWRPAFVGLSLLLLISPIHAETSQSSGVIHVPTSNRDQATAYLIVSRSAYPGPLAHYAEHLAWLNSVGNAKASLDRHSNAWTDTLVMGYRQSAPSGKLQDTLRTLLAVFEPINLPPSFAEEERDIILREYDFRLGNNPDGTADEAEKAFLYAGNIDAASVLGPPSEIRAMTYEAAKDLHAATHRPELARLVVIGDVSAADLRAAMDEAGFPAEFGTEPVSPPAFELQASETRMFSYPLDNVTPRLTWRRVVTLEEPIDFDLLEVQASLLRDILDSNLPGGIAGPLRFDHLVARSFSVNVWPIDEDNVEISFSAEPDAGVSFAKLQSTFEAALGESSVGIPPETYERVHRRFQDYWPDWTDEDAKGQWMADYVLSRVRALREPLSEDQLKGLAGKLKAEDINGLLKALTVPGRTAVTHIGKDKVP